jgi:hypothetical protein
MTYLGLHWLHWPQRSDEVTVARLGSHEAGFPSDLKTTLGKVRSTAPPQTEYGSWSTRMASIRREGCRNRICRANLRLEWEEDASCFSGERLDLSL